MPTLFCAVSVFFISNGQCFLCLLYQNSLSNDSIAHILDISYSVHLKIILAIWIDWKFYRSSSPGFLCFNNPLFSPLTLTVSGQGNPNQYFNTCLEISSAKYPISSVKSSIIHKHWNSVRSSSLPLYSKNRFFFLVSNNLSLIAIWDFSQMVVNVLCPSCTSKII